MKQTLASPSLPCHCFSSPTAASPGKAAVNLLGLELTCHPREAMYISETYTQMCNLLLIWIGGAHWVSEAEKTQLWCSGMSKDHMVSFFCNTPWRVLNLWASVSFLFTRTEFSQALFFLLQHKASGMEEVFSETEQKDWDLVKLITNQNETDQLSWTTSARATSVSPVDTPL